MTIMHNLGNHIDKEDNQYEYLKGAMCLVTSLNCICHFTRGILTWKIDFPQADPSGRGQNPSCASLVPYICVFTSIYRIGCRTGLYLILKFYSVPKKTIKVWVALYRQL